VIYNQLKKCAQGWGMNLRLLINIGLYAVIIVIITGCGNRDVPVPTGVTATPGNGQITIAWTVVKDVTSYNIYWSTTPGVTTM
jgi:hypothetical protein